MDVDPDRSIAWSVVVPIRGGSGSKSRLARDDRLDLAEAMARDTIAVAARAVGDPSRIVVVSATAVPEWVVDGGHRVVRDDGGGLDAAARLGAATAWRQDAAGVAVLLGDHPCLRVGELRAALAAASAHAGAYVPDASGSGTALVTSTRPGLLDCAFGPGSAARHDALGLTRLTLDAPGLRLDVDDTADLVSAAALGPGPHTTALGYARERAGDDPLHA